MIYKPGLKVLSAGATSYLLLWRGFGPVGTVLSDVGGFTPVEELVRSLKGRDSSGRSKARACFYQLEFCKEQAEVSWRDENRNTIETIAQEMENDHLRTKVTKIPH
ncbi:hypothetical protein C1645_740401 [Glomus cerebriforme]|uniref:Uncharacterized protein n=1 Tax=Glomus cerebriforme TaxID=658196 RepID=A0A397SQZ8_9GLOM|nr:hypothetical protein C1645_740401 [Glomus cerebriforme]